MSKVLIVPNWSKSNPYQGLLIQNLEKQGDEVSLSNFPDSPLPFSQLLKENPSTQVLHLHWISDLVARMCWSKNPIVFLLKLLLLKIDFIRTKNKGVKVIWTIHNKLAHQNHNKKKELQIRRLVASQVDNIIVHSQEAIPILSSLYNVDISQKSKVIFHGNYDGCYPEPSHNREQLRAEKNISDEKLLLFFGNIRPYKGLEVLITAFENAAASNSKSRLHIAGQIPDKNYRENISQKIQQHPLISSQIEFIPDQTLSDLLSASDAVILPFADTLTSGTVILAMTFGKALILPESAKIFGCLPPEGVMYFKDTEHLQSIIENIEDLDTESMGRANQERAKTMSWQSVAKMTSSLYAS